MSEPRQPCHCPTCNGALVALRTRQLHASCLPPTSIPSFPAWSQQFGVAFTGEPSNRSLDSDDDGVDHSPGSSQHNSEYSRPSKRLQSSTVCLSIPSFCSNLCILYYIFIVHVYTGSLYEINPYGIYLSGCLSI